jgi:hypothetical protein
VRKAETSRGGTIPVVHSLPSGSSDKGEVPGLPEERPGPAWEGWDEIKDHARLPLWGGGNASDRARQVRNERIVQYFTEARGRDTVVSILGPSSPAVAGRTNTSVNPACRESRQPRRRRFHAFGSRVSAGLMTTGGQPLGFGQEELRLNPARSVVSLDERERRASSTTSPYYGKGRGDAPNSTRARLGARALTSSTSPLRSRPETNDRMLGNARTRDLVTKCPECGGGESFMPFLTERGPASAYRDWNRLPLCLSSCSL